MDPQQPAAGGAASSWVDLLRARVGREDGVALVLALAVSVTLSIMVFSVTTYATSNLHNSSNSAARLSARTFAEAALNMGVSIVNKASNAALPTLLGCSTSAQNVNNSSAPCTDLSVALTGGTGYVHGLYAQGNVNTGTWTIYAWGKVDSPTSAGDVSQVLTATVTVTGGGQSNNISIWNYLYSTAPAGSGCEVDLNGDHVQIQVPIYVTGDLCLSGDHASIVEDRFGGGQAVDVRVGGTLTINGNHASVGQDSRHPITSGYVAGGCRTSTFGTFHTCTSADDWYVSQTDSPLTASPPTTDFPGWYQNASPGPRHPCDPVLTPTPKLSTSQPNAFDNDTTMNGTNSTFILTPTGFTSDYNCVTSSGSLKWERSKHLLTMSGTIYFDGNVQLNDDTAMYLGKATIYVNGQLSFNDGHGNHAGLRAACTGGPGGGYRQCAINGPGADHWDPNQNMVIFAVNKATGVAVDLTQDHTEFQGDLLCTPTSTAALAGDHTQVEGGIICGKFTWGDHTAIYPLPTITNLPPGAPVPPNAPATISPPNFTRG